MVYNIDNVANKDLACVWVREKVDKIPVDIVRLVRFYGGSSICWIY